MSKKNELATIEEKTTAVVPASIAGGLQFDGADQDDYIVPRLHMFQDTSYERDNIGKEFDLGDLVDPLEQRKLASNRIVPIIGWKSWAKWEDGQSAPVYSTRDRLAVPADDLEWHDKEPPAATEMFNMLVAVEGEMTPYLLVLKRTSIKAAKQLLTLEKMRGAKQQGPGLYAVEFTKETGGSGVYAKMKLRPAGNPDADMLELVQTFADAYGDTSKIREADDAAEPPDFLAA